MTKNAEIKPDWDRHTITAEIRRKGLTFSGLSRAHGLHNTSIRTALYQSAPKYEVIIAEVIGVAPEEIWPSRYTAEAIAANPYRRAALATVNHPAAFLPPPESQALINPKGRIRKPHSNRRETDRNVCRSDSGKGA